MADEVRLARCAAVLEPGDPPRAGAVVFWDTGDAEEPGRIEGGGADRIGVVVPAGESVQIQAVPAQRLPMDRAIPLLLALSEGADVHPAVVFWSAAARAALHLVARGRVMPGVSPGGFDAWRVGPLDVSDVERTRALAAAMPASARAVPLDPGAAVLRLPDADGMVRAFLDAVADTMMRTPAGPWLTAGDAFASAEPVPAEDLRTWAGEVSIGVDSGLQIDLRLEVRGDATPASPVKAAPVTAVVWLRDLADPTRITDAAALWAGDKHGFGMDATFEAIRAVRRAARAWPSLERLLHHAEPVELDLYDEDLLDLLDGSVERLAAAGVEVRWPPDFSRDLGSRGLISSPEHGPADVAAFCRTGPAMPMGWQLTLAGEPLTDAETAVIASGRPVLRIRDQWVLVPSELARRARVRPLEPLPPGDALTAMLVGVREIEGEDIEVVADGWFGELGARIGDPDAGPEPLEAPAALAASLRDYQLRGLRWLDRMTSLGFGGCLADDMGLGKTIMLIALHLRRQLAPSTAGPTLVVCPASVLGNWEREIARFAPGTPVRRFHGSSRSLGPGDTGFVLTTYGTMRIDARALAGRTWGLVAADEAQYVKNRLSSTARALREIPASARVALTGTPVENNTSELWAILDWTTPGLLGSVGAFRATWARPVETGRQGAQAGRLSRLVRPFLLRRRKSDPGIAPELPPKTETDHTVALTAEQVDLYRAVTAEVMAEIRASGPGIARRGLVLRLLVGLKQVCNHPAQYLKEAQPRLGGRSEKLALLDDLLDTILAEEGAALVFTQYVQMARLLERHLGDRGIPTEFLHGGTPVTRRDEMVRRFQSGEVPVFLLSLRAGGTGLNLTRADHVIHYDRWWNPAVEEQATDRAYRIGQTRPVQVHRLIAVGTLEDRIAELLESKRELAEAILNRGEAALTELGDTELARLVELRGVG